MGEGNRLLYVSMAGSGGLADYAREQAGALVRLGVEVELLSPSGFAVRPVDPFHPRPLLKTRSGKGPRLLARISGAGTVLQNHRRLVRAVKEGNHDHVLLGSYAEYLAPLWAGSLQALARKGVVFGAVVHDPVRDHVVGSPGWHRRSVAAAYSFLREAFVHDEVELDTVRPVPGLRTTIIPHGPYAFPAVTRSREEARRDLHLPESAPVWLSFGHIRDGKNLDLVLRALAQFPEAHLVVAGREQSRGQRPVAFYQELARQLGVESRCHWHNRFIAAEEVGNLFAAADLALLTYSARFRSASGVLNAAVHFRKPSLASGGQGNLRSMVMRYQLGAWAEPDDLESLVAGVRRLMREPLTPQWEAYEVDNSWQRNAEIVRDRLFSEP